MHFPQGSGWTMLLPTGVMVLWAVCQESTLFLCVVIAYGVIGAPFLLNWDLHVRVIFRV